MDWEKAKSNMIVALLITNVILLGFILFNRSITYDKSNSEDFIEYTRKKLEENGNIVDTKIPNRSPRLGTLSAEFETLEAKKLDDSFFDGRGIISTDPGKETIDFGQEHLTLINSRRLLYESTSSEGKNEIKNKEDAIIKTENFLKSKGYDTRDIKLDRAYKQDDLFHVEYVKEYNGKVMEKTFTNFILDKKGVRQMDRLWINVKDKSRKKINLPSASKALLSLVDKKDNGNGKIIEMAPCYYFDPESQGYVEDITKALRGRAIPAWRIKFENGTNYVVDNY